MIEVSQESERRGERDRIGMPMGSKDEREREGVRDLAMGILDIEVKKKVVNYWIIELLKFV